MIKSFRHKGLKRLSETGERRGVAPQLAARLRRQLDVLNRAMTTADLNLPGYRLHQLKEIALARGVSPLAAIGALRSHSKVKMLSTWTSKIIIEDTHYGEHVVE